MHIRPARPDDVDPVTAFTTGTFDWGDYVPDRLPAWLDDSHSIVMVATDESDSPIGLARAIQMSEREAWIHAARVHPDHRRTGVGSAINEALCGWAGDRGASIVRLLTEEWNTAAQGQVESSGYRRICQWSWPMRELGSGRIDPVTNGGRRVPGEEQLASGSRAEIDPAWVAWSTSELAAAGRNLYPLGWTFRRMRLEDVQAASRARELMQCASGWVIAKTQADDTELFVPWVVTNSLDAPRLARAVVDLAARRRMSSVMVMIPSIGWLEDAFEQAGCEIRRGFIYARTL